MSALLSTIHRAIEARELEIKQARERGRREMAREVADRSDKVQWVSSWTYLLQQREELRHYAEHGRWPSDPKPGEGG